MELRLQKFITAMESITDIYNLDNANPMMLNMPHPLHVEGAENEAGLIGENFRMIVAVDEPWYVGLPINGIWINLYPHSLHYRRALKLKAVTDPTTSNVTSAVTDSNYVYSWVVLERYDSMFDEQQVQAGSTAGPKGPRGDLGINRGAAYSPAGVYSKGMSCRYNGGDYVSLTNNNVNNTPGSSAAWLTLSTMGDAPVVDYDYIIEQVQSRLQS